MEYQETHNNKTILFFDGLCNLCDGYVQWIIKRDPSAYFHFASLQSDFAINFSKEIAAQVKEVNSVILFHQGQYYTESDVPLEIIKQLGLPWAILYSLKWVPRIIRDKVYRFVARNRYQWFGKKAECMVPSVDIQDRFLDSLGS